MFEKLLEQLKKLSTKTVVIKAHGEYPNGTPVQHVAHYQNDGTPTIKPAKFVEAAIREHRKWKTPTREAIAGFLSGNDSALENLGWRVATDINVAVNRIRTGRLKTSMRPEVK
jgi:hypothetical protein